MHEGGLGVRDLQHMVDVFSVKLWWWLRQKNSIWAEFMSAKYIKERHPASVEVLRGSPTWRRLVAVRDLAEENLAWCIGEGLVDFWHDRWVGDIPLVQRCARDSYPHFLVCEFFTNEGWDEEKLRRWIPRGVVDEIRQIVIQTGEKDKLLWLPSTSGEFSVASAWEEIRYHKSSSLVMRMIWDSVVPLKFSLLAWRAVYGYLPVDRTMQRRGVQMASKCSCCDQVESVLHLFVHGRVARDVWRHYFRAFGLSFREFHSVPSLLMAWRMSAPAERHVRCVVPVIVLWFIWIGRNEAVFQGAQFSAARIIAQVDNFLFVLGKSCCVTKGFVKTDELVYISKLFTWRKATKVGFRVIRWVKPLEGDLKLNTDASVRDGVAYGGGVLRDHNGDVVWAFYKEFGDISILEAETRALMFGLSIALEREAFGLLVEVDSKVLVSLVEKQSTSSWSICYLLSSIRHLLRVLQGRLSHVYRQANSVADAIASFPFIHQGVIHHLPSSIMAVVNLDKVGIPQVRRFHVRE